MTEAFETVHLRRGFCSGFCRSFGKTMTWFNEMPDKVQLHLGG